MSLGETAAIWWKNVDKKNLAILLLIFILGFAVRAHLMKYDLIFGFDSYFHARITSYVIEDFAVPEFDPLAYYQEGGAPLHTLHVSFFWYFCAALYKLFTLGAPYNKELWIFFVKLLPALFGALISAAMFLLGKEAYGRKAGVAMGFFAAVIPAFAYRTMAGFLEEDALGFLWMVLGFYFLIKAVKEPAWQRDKLLQAAASGFFFGLMALTWRLFLLVPMVLIAYVVVTLGMLFSRLWPQSMMAAFGLITVTSTWLITCLFHLKM
jgi:dolichyl-diphosphooligosaccharide--protein glycosyltransferase